MRFHGKAERRAEHLQLVVMGVAGAGKTTVGRLLATRLRVPFLDADDYHSTEAIARMRAGYPLDDARRAVWLDRLATALHALSDPDFVLACSALRRAYRDTLRSGVDDPVFVLLDVDVEVLARRLQARTGHFAGVALLESQLATLELGDDVLVVDADAPPDEVTNRVLAAMGARAGC